MWIGFVWLWKGPEACFLGLGFHRIPGISLTIMQPLAYQEHISPIQLVFSMKIIKGETYVITQLTYYIICYSGSVYSVQNIFEHLVSVRYISHSFMKFPNGYGAIITESVQDYPRHYFMLKFQRSFLWSSFKN